MHSESYSAWFVYVMQFCQVAYVILAKLQVKLDDYFVSCMTADKLPEFLLLTLVTGALFTIADL